MALHTKCELYMSIYEYIVIYDVYLLPIIVSWIFFVARLEDEQFNIVLQCIYCNRQSTSIYYK